MNTYLVMGKFTDQGIKNVKETTKRANRFKEIAKECGVKVKEIMWLMGDFDVINIVETGEEKKPGRASIAGWSLGKCQDHNL